MATFQEFTPAPDPAHLQTLHRLATVRYDNLIDELYAVKGEDEQAERHRSRLRRQEEQRHGFILELNRLLYEAGVDPLA